MNNVFYWPKLKNAESIVLTKAFFKSKEIYGDTLPNAVKKRLKWELDAFCEHNFCFIFAAMEKIVKKARANGYPVGSSGCIASSFVAFLLGITDINPLPSHYLCQNCKYSNFKSCDNCYIGFDLPDTTCLVCGQKLNKHGFNLAVETLLGIDGDKVPDVKLHFPSAYINSAHSHLAEIFTEYRIFPIETHSDSRRRFRELFLIPRDIDISELDSEQISDHFFKFTFCEDATLSQLYDLQKLTSIARDSIPLDGIEQLTNSKDDITTRDDVLHFLTAKGLSKREAYRYMQIIAHGGIARKEEFINSWRSIAIKFNLPDKYVDSAEKVRYLLPKSEAVESAIKNYQIAWYNKNYPEEFSKLRSLL